MQTPCVRLAIRFVADRRVPRSLPRTSPVDQGIASIPSVRSASVADSLDDMDAMSLRALQAPLKQRYRSDPSSARTPIGARADYRDADVTCTVEGWAGPARRPTPGHWG